MNLPRWAWYIISIVVVLIVLVVCKVNVEIGSGGLEPLIDYLDIPRQ